MNKFKVGIVVAVIGVMISSAVFAANLVTEVYFSNFKIKLNGAEYNPEMPVLNYLGRTYLALRELGTVTGNHIDFVNNEIIINNEEKETVQPKKVVQQEVIFNNNKHNFQIQYFYNDEDKMKMSYEGDEGYTEVVPCEKRILLDNKVVTSINELHNIRFVYYDPNKEDIVYNNNILHYVIYDTVEGYNEQYIVYENNYMYYIINEKGQLLGCIRDMAFSSGATTVGLVDEIGPYNHSSYNHAQGKEYSEMYPEITKDSIQLCYPNCPSDVSWQESFDIDWYRVKYTIEYGELKSNIIKFYDADKICVSGAT